MGISDRSLYAVLRGEPVLRLGGAPAGAIREQPAHSAPRRVRRSARPACCADRPAALGAGGLRGARARRVRPADIPPRPIPWRATASRRCPHGERIGFEGGQARGPRHADHPLHRGRRHRPRHLARVACACSTPPSRRPTAASGEIAWMEVFAGEKAFTAAQRLAAAGDASTRSQEFRVSHQGAAHHAGRRRHPLAERHAAPGARPLRLHPPGALLRGRRRAGEGAGEGQRRDLPREHRGRVRRHRVEGRHRPRPNKLREYHRRRSSRRRSARTRRSASSRCPSSARSAWSRWRSSYAIENEPRVGDARAQGQHHEVHRGRVPRLGLRGRARASSADARDRGGSGARRQRVARRLPSS